MGEVSLAATSNIPNLRNTRVFSVVSGQRILTGVATGMEWCGDGGHYSQGWKAFLCQGDERVMHRNVRESDSRVSGLEDGEVRSR